MTFPLNPWVLFAATWLAVPIVLGFARRCRGFFRWWGVGFAIAIGLDGWLSGPLSPYAPESAWVAWISVVFVILGDVRAALAVEWDGRPRSAFVAFGIACIVPIVTQVLRVVIPAIARTPRITFLVYEVGFLIALLAYQVRVRRMPEPRRSLAVSVSRFVGLQYGLWASIDTVVLLTKSDLVLGLRFLPDALYYVAFVPYVLHRVRRRS